jgi:hypothetical protein
MAELQFGNDPSESKLTPDFSELGTSGINRWGDNVYEEFLPQLQYPRAAKVYKEMSDNDPTIGAIFFAAKQLIRKAGWDVEAASDSQADKDAAEFLRSCMDDMSMSWANTISEILAMLPYGFSFHEIVYKVRKGPHQNNSKYRSKYSDGRIGWSRIPSRSQHTMTGWEFAENGDIKGFRQQAPPSYKSTVIPLSKGLLFRTEIARDNPEGRSLLRNAYRPWYFKKRIEEIEGIGIERDLAGLPVITPPENIDIWDPNNPEGRRIKAIAENLVRNIRRDRSEGVVKPHGWELDLLSTGGSRQFDTNGIINRYDNRIAITMLADIVMMGGDKVGSFALGEVKKSMLAASLESLIQHIADVFNTFAVPKLFMFNYFPGISDYPKIKPGEVETPDIKDMAFLLRAGGLQVSQDLPLMNLIRRLISLDPLTEEQLANWYPTADPKEEIDPEKDLKDVAGDSQNKDPLGHAMDDGSQNFEGK